MLTHCLPRTLRRIAGVAAVAFVVVLPRSVLAQSSPDSASWYSSVAAWGSGGIGAGSTQDPLGGGVAAVARGAVSVGPLLLMYRASDVGPFISAGSGVRSAAVLAGVRTRGHRVFESAALGYARASPYHQSDNSSYPTVAPSVTVLAYDVSFHVNAVVAGLALSISGDVGPQHSTNSVVTLSLELGWFGR